MASKEFGRYLLHRRLARGGMAEIFLAEQRATAGVSKLVVVKRILPELEPGSTSKLAHDSSTNRGIEWFREHRK